LYLKSLTLKGFKSFASSTTLQLEPGITCIVGPNGSGKSNVVDALAWVMGEQGAKSLRGGKMEDVIFAGTAGRAPLGRAEVALTIDNSDGALPIDYTEVTIARTMFRNGGSEYAINGTPCRLLDVQELLSDSGIGREMHVIVGQGQLDAVLRATPEERRGFIEEAAGVLKHRKRKEKALRKLESMEAFLLAGILASGAVAALFGLLCVRYTKIFFGILTMALSQVLWSLAFKFFWVTGGSDGLRVPTPTLLGGFVRAGNDKFEFLSHRYYFYVLAVFVVAVAVM